MTEDYLYLKKNYKLKEFLNNASSFKKSQLRVYAISRYGLINNKIREKAWPLLLNLEDEKNDIDRNLYHFHNHKYYTQVTMDVERSLKRYPPGLSDEERKHLETKTVTIIMNILQKDLTLHYYQGYHDVVITFVLVLDEKMAYIMMKSLSNTHYRQFMAPSMAETGEVLAMLYPLLDKVDHQLSTYLKRVGLGTIFCLSWLITWFAHALNNLEPIARLYDFFLACPDPHLPMYLATAVVLYRRDQIYACENDMPEIHKLLSSIPAELPLEDLIDVAANLYLAYPPPKLESARREYVEQTELKAAQAKAQFRERQRKQTKNPPATIARRARLQIAQRYAYTFARRYGKYLAPVLALFLSWLAYNYFRDPSAILMNEGINKTVIDLI